MALKKSKRGSMLSSVLSITLCTAMLIGGTLAWFKDTASTGKNTIKTGTLDVSLTRDGKSLEGVDNIFNLEGVDNFLQPGEIISTGKMLVKNEGNMKLNYRLNITHDTLEGNAKALKDLMKVKVDGKEVDIDSYTSYLEPGQSHEVVMEIDMDANKGNEYQNLTINNLMLTVEASQCEIQAHKVDSNTNIEALVEDILKAETLPETLSLDVSTKGVMNFNAISSNLEELVAKGVKEVIIEGNNIRSTDNKTTIVFDGNGTDTIAAPNGGTLIFRNVTIVDKSNPYSGEAWEYCNLDMGGKLSFDNVTFDSGVMLESTDATFTGCTFNKIYGIDGNHKTNRYAAWVSSGNATFEGCTFNSARNIKVHEAYGSEVNKVVVNNCTFTGIVKPAVAIGDVSKDVTIEITNNDVNKSALTDYSTYAKQGVFESDTKKGDFTLIENNNN